MRSIDNNTRNQKRRWDVLGERFHDFFMNVRIYNICNLIAGLLTANIIRGAALFCNSCLLAQMTFPEATCVYAAVVAVFNSRFPWVGYLLLKRLILGFKRAYVSSNKEELLITTKFLAHLVNQRVCNEDSALEVLNILLEIPTDDSVKVAVEFLKDCGSFLQEFQPHAMDVIFELLQVIHDEGQVSRKIYLSIEWLILLREVGFEGYPALRPDLDLLWPKDRLTHEICIEEEIDPEHEKDIFKVDPQYLKHENDYRDYLKAILTEDYRRAAKGKGIVVDGESSHEQENKEEKIKDETETEYCMRCSFGTLNRRVFLAILSSDDYVEASDKLMSIKPQPFLKLRICKILITCCRAERTYLPYHGFLGQHLCEINAAYKKKFAACFIQDYSKIIDDFGQNGLIHMARFYAQLLASDALCWHVLSIISLSEEHLESFSRFIFLEVLFRDLSLQAGERLHEGLNNAYMQESFFTSIFGNHNPRDIISAILFFRSIGLCGMTGGLQTLLKKYK